MRSQDTCSSASLSCMKGSPRQVLVGTRARALIAAVSLALLATACSNGATASPTTEAPLPAGPPFQNCDDDLQVRGDSRDRLCTRGEGNSLCPYLG
jgi:hypothetical protein